MHSPRCTCCPLLFSAHEFTLFIFFLWQDEQSSLMSCVQCTIDVHYYCLLPPLDSLQYNWYPLLSAFDMSPCCICSLFILGLVLIAFFSNFSNHAAYATNLRLYASLIFVRGLGILISFASSVIFRSSIESNCCRFVVGQFLFPKIPFVTARNRTDSCCLLGKRCTL